MKNLKHVKNRKHYLYLLYPTFFPKAQHIYNWGLSVCPFETLSSNPTLLEFNYLIQILYEESEALKKRKHYLYLLYLHFFIKQSNYTIRIFPSNHRKRTAVGRTNNDCPF